MTLISIEFIALLLPLCYVFYVLFGKTARGQNIVLLVASAVFYGFYDLKYILVMCASIALTYFGGILGSKQQDKERPGRYTPSSSCLTYFSLLCSSTPSSSLAM